MSDDCHIIQKLFTLLKDASDLLFGRADIGVFSGFVVHPLFLFQNYKHLLNLMFHCKVQGPELQCLLKVKEDLS